jgi:hypothetical protein
MFRPSAGLVIILFSLRGPKGPLFHRSDLLIWDRDYFQLLFELKIKLNNPSLNQPPGAVAFSFPNCFARILFAKTNRCPGKNFLLSF